MNKMSKLKILLTCLFAVGIMYCSRQSARSRARVGTSQANLGAKFQPEPPHATVGAAFRPNGPKPN